MTQGGEWGSAISREMGRTEPQRVIGVQVNLLVNGHATEKPDPTELGLLSPAERDRTIASWAAFQEWLGERAGYAAMQSTRPQTLAYGLTDSPVGQLAWIVEKFKDWTDSHDRAENAIDRGHLLTNVSIYWFTATAGSSARIYHERAHADHR